MINHLSDILQDSMIFSIMHTRIRCNVVGLQGFFRTITTICGSFQIICSWVWGIFCLLQKLSCWGLDSGPMVEDSGEVIYCLESRFAVADRGKRKNSERISNLGLKNNLGHRTTMLGTVGSTEALQIFMCLLSYILLVKSTRRGLIGTWCFGNKMQNLKRIWSTKHVLSRFLKIILQLDTSLFVYSSLIPRLLQLDTLGFHNSEFFGSGF